MTGSGDTIFAPASGLGRAAIAVIRISGPRARHALQALAGPPPPPRRASLRRLRDPATGELLDQALVLWLPGPASATGEDQAELHIHASPAVRAAVLLALSGIDGCRPADAGEFTRRSFRNGRMDLAQVEGLADLIEAETEAQRRQALRQLDGELGRQSEVWREEALQILALMEAVLDFADEGDVPLGLDRHIHERIVGLEAGIAAMLAKPGGERLREGYTVVLAGVPNAGKSTLLNAIARRDVAIVSPIPGTTRDALEIRCDLAGLPITFVDTAGLRESDDPVEREGVSRARARVQAADLVLWLVAPGGAAPSGAGMGLVVRTKADLGPSPGGSGLAVSALTGDGMEGLLAAIAARAASRLGSGDAVLTRERHRTALRRAQNGLKRAERLILDRAPAELAAEDLRIAAQALGTIAGRVDVEDVLDRVFSAFCIGK